MMGTFTHGALGLLLCFSLSYCAAGQPDQRIEQRLRELDARRDGLNTEPGVLEKEALQLLDEGVLPEDRGKVYAQIALIYAQSGLTRPAKTAEYCMKALENPLDPATAAQTYVFWADALEVQARRQHGEVPARAKREIAEICLDGVKMILDHDVPAARQPLPRVHRVSLGNGQDDAAHRDFLAKHEAQLTARKRIMLLNTLVHHRDALLDKVIRLYQGNPMSLQEFRRLTEGILGDERAEQLRNLLSRRLERTKRE